MLLTVEPVWENTAQELVSCGNFIIDRNHHEKTSLTAHSYEASAFEARACSAKMLIGNEDIEVHISVFKRNNIPQLTRCTMCCKRYHCPLCPTVMYKSRCKAKVLQHMEVHLKNALQHEDFYITKCHWGCRSGASGHFHCPFCFKTTIRRQDSIRHLEICRPPYHDGHQQLQGVATCTEGQNIISQTVASVPCLTEREERQSQQQEPRADSVLLPHLSWHDNDQLSVVLPCTSPPSSVGATSTPTKTTEKRLSLTHIQKRNSAARFQVVLRSPQQPVPHPGVTPSTSGTYLAFPVVKRTDSKTLPDTTERHSPSEECTVPGKSGQLTSVSKKWYYTEKDHSKIDIGEALYRWRELMVRLELNLDTELATFLLNWYEQETLQASRCSQNAALPGDPARLSDSAITGEVSIVKEENAEDEVLNDQLSFILKKLRKGPDEVKNSYERDPSVSTQQKQGTMRPAPPTLSATTKNSPSDWTCSVVGCDSGRRSAQRYKLPKDPDMRLKWVQFLLEVNEQQLKESSWTDITICSEHFTQDCYDHQTAQLKFEAVPSLCIKTEPEEHLKSPHVVDNTVGDLDTSSTPSFSPTPHPNPMQQKVTTGMKREEASLLQIDKTFLLTEHGLLKLFVHKCPSCDHELQLEQVANEELIVVNQQCHRCNYRFQWKSQANAGVPTVEHQTGGSEETPECQQATPEVEVPEVPVSQYSTEVITVMNAEAAATEELKKLRAPEGDDTEGELSAPEGINTDEEWIPSDQFVLTESDVEESDVEESDMEENDPMHKKLCTDCGTFFNKRRPHMCEHKIKPFSCNICGKRCISEQALRSHSRIHNVNYEFPCKYCSLTFKTKADKMTHEVIHATEEKPYKCPDCSETFALNKERSTHLEVHRGPRQSTCDICGMDFRGPGYLQRHMAVHTGLKPFKCASCSRAFKQASHLKSHMRLHTGERPYKCQYCDKCFNHNVSLKSHIQRYHPSNSVENNTTEKDAGYDIVEQYKPKPRRKQKSGRPIGRPKNSEFGNSTEGHSSNSKTRKPQSKKSKRRYSHDEESEDTGDGSSSGSEEERGRKRTKITARSRGQAENVDSDLDFNPAEVKKQRHSSQNSADSSPKRRGRPRKKN
ncbi:uncharacterized protein V6R79_026320 [Siganus canaliculatus]